MLVHAACPYLYGFSAASVSSGLSTRITLTRMLGERLGRSITREVELLLI
jgi:hypothetical protein